MYGGAWADTSEATTDGKLPNRSCSASGPVTEWHSGAAAAYQPRFLRATGQGFSNERQALLRPDLTGTGLDELIRRRERFHTDRRRLQRTGEGKLESTIDLAGIG